MLSGELVFSLTEDVTVKRIGLRLVGRYKLDFLEVLSQSNTTVANPVKEESVIFEVQWDNLLLNPNGIIGKQDQGNTGTHTQTRRLIRTNTPLSLNVPSNGVSVTPFQGFVVPNGTSFVLPEGNYEFPFKCILPGDIPETVEGLMAGSILYKFEAVVDRRGFKSPLMRYKYFRILRTLSSDNFSISETISIGKTWPDKVQYEVSIPSRAVPIGGASPIKIVLVPLSKGLKLGPIKAQMVQYYAFKGSAGDIYDDEQVVLDCTMSKMEGKVLYDRLSIDSFIKIPSNLKKVTQDCDLKGDRIKVRHKLKLQINLINSNGHTSELRTNIPITLFISPNVEMSGRTVMLDKHGKIHFRKEEEKLFETSHRMNRTTTTGNNFSISGREAAPPNYEEHVFDRMIFTEPTVEHGDTTPLAVLLNHGDEMRREYFGNDASLSVSPMLEAEDESEQTAHLIFGGISNVPSYQDAVDGNDVPNPGEEFAPSYPSGALKAIR
jgi:hypothetical protein